MAQDSVMIRVDPAERELIMRIAGVLTSQTARKVTNGDVVADAVRVLLDTRPDVAIAVRDAQQAVQ